MKGLLLTYGLAYGGAIAALVNPWYGLLAYLALSTLRPDTLWFWSVTPGPYSRVAAIGLVIGWALHGFGNWNFGAAKPVFVAIVGYWAWIIVSALAAPNQQVAWTYVELFSKILLPVVVGFTLIDSVARLKQVAWLLVLCIGYVAYEANLDYFLGGYRLRNYGFFGVDNNSACICLALGCGMAFFLGLSETVWWRRWFCFSLAGLLAHCPMFGDSRGGMLGLIATGVVTLVLVPKTFKNLVLFALAAWVAFMLAGPPVIERFQTVFASGGQRDSSAQSRLDLWADCWDAMQTNPVTGLGPDHFPLAARDRYGWGSRKESHSLWFNTGAELGFPGLALLFGFYGITIWRLCRLRMRNEFADPWLRDAANMAIASLTGFAVSASFVSLDAMEPPYFVVVFGAGVIRVASQSQPALKPLSLTSSSRAESELSLV